MPGLPPGGVVLAAADTLIDIENVRGSASSESIYGNAGDNVLEGFSGNDVLRGGAGNDTLDGGASSVLLPYPEFILPTAARRYRYRGLFDGHRPASR